MFYFGNFYSNHSSPLDVLLLFSIPIDFFSLLFSTTPSSFFSYIAYLYKEKEEVDEKQDYTFEAAIVVGMILKARMARPRRKQSFFDGVK